jgi:hypothetical protein
MMMDFTPDRTKQIKHAHYFGHEGYAAITTDTTLIFRTPTSLWVPVLEQAELILLGEVGDAAAQRALDDAAGGLPFIATHRTNLEV